MVASMPAVMDRRRTMEPSMMRPTMPSPSERSGRDCREGDCYYEFLHLICPFLFPIKSVSRRADQPADNRADCRRAKGNPSGIAAAVMVGVMNDMIPRRRAAMMNRCRTAMTSMMGRGNRRAGREDHARNENQNCFDDLVHITPTTFFLLCCAGVHLPLTRRQETHIAESDKEFSHRYLPVAAG